MSLSTRFPGKRTQSKLRSMPLRKTPSAVYIQMHQLANEKERLQQELRMLSDRQQQILQRLQEVDQGLIQLEADASNYALQLEMSPEVLVKANQQVAVQKAKTSQTQKVKAGDKSYNSMTIEY